MIILRVFFTTLTVMIFATGCTSSPVKSWDKALLAKPEMRWENTADQQSLFRDRVYFSKEASSGGGIKAGGGCGCN